MDAVTGAFGYTGKYIARRLLAEGREVITLTGNPHRLNPFGEQVRAFPFDFDHPSALAARLKGVDTLYNTYWVRFPHGETSYESAVENTRTLISAAKTAGVRRFVHVSITNPSPDSPLPYFRGKGILEGNIQASGLSYAIIRPTVIFGQEDILINNIAFLLRRFPLFAVPGDGQYRLQPIFVEDIAEIAVRAAKSAENLVLDAAGPEVFTFEQLGQTIAAQIGRRPLLIHLPPLATWLLSAIISLWVKDVVLTRDEVRGLMAGLLVTDGLPTGGTRLSDWLEQNKNTVGKHYASELRRHYRS
jgi:NADH dehydrogenase